MDATKPRGGGQARPPKTPPLKTTEFPDGTGRIGLPSGWSIASSYKGSVDVVGPGGASVRLGIPFLIVPPDAPAVYQTTNPVAPRGDLIGGLKAVFRHMDGQARAGGQPGLTFKRVVASAPAPPALSGVAARYLIYEFTQGGTPMSALGYFTALPGTETNWVLYGSGVLAPAAKFRALFPTMLAMWRSWSPGGAVRPGSQTEAIDRMIARRKEAAERANHAFIEYLRR